MAKKKKARSKNEKKSKVSSTWQDQYDKEVQHEMAAIIAARPDVGLREVFSKALKPRKAANGIAPRGPLFLLDPVIQRTELKQLRMLRHSLSTEKGLVNTKKSLVTSGYKVSQFIEITDKPPIMLPDQVEIVVPVGYKYMPNKKDTKISLASSLPPSMKYHDQLLDQTAMHACFRSSQATLSKWVTCYGGIRTIRVTENLKKPKRKPFNRFDLADLSKLKPSHFKSSLRLICKDADLRRSMLLNHCRKEGASRPYLKPFKTYSVEFCRDYPVKNVTSIRGGGLAMWYFDRAFAQFLGLANRYSGETNEFEIIKYDFRTQNGHHGTIKIYNKNEYLRTEVRFEKEKSPPKFKEKQELFEFLCGLGAIAKETLDYAHNFALKDPVLLDWDNLESTLRAILPTFKWTKLFEEEVLKDICHYGIYDHSKYSEDLSIPDHHYRKLQKVGVLQRGRRQALQPKGHDTVWKVCL
jgi:hypothetical protein